jgi:predicted N-acetyltransferase YhbS
MDELIGRRRHITATCDLIVSNALPMGMRRNVRELHDLHTPEEDRGKGYASQLMHDLCRDADEHGMLLMLVADDVKLAAFYSRWGFQPIQAKPLIMARMCGATPRTVKPISQAINEVLH